MSSSAFSGNSLLASLLVGMVGFALFNYGRKQRRIPQLAIGLLMCVYPYFVPDPLFMGGIFVLLSGLMYALIKLGL